MKQRDQKDVLSKDQLKRRYDAHFPFDGGSDPSELMIGGSNRGELIHYQR